MCLLICVCIHVFMCLCIYVCIPVHMASSSPLGLTYVLSQNGLLPSREESFVVRVLIMV